jgi:hypothetical protein
MARNTFYTYRYLFSAVGMELEDVTNIGRVHLVSFIGLFEFSETKNLEKYQEFLKLFAKKNKDQIPTTEDTVGKNKANLTMFMKQRMEDLVRICKQKAKNIRGLRIDEYIPFYGSQPPPEELYKLLEDNETYGFKRADAVMFKALKKRLKADLKEPFAHAGVWYVAVPLEQRSLNVLDLAGAGLDPADGEHYRTPEYLLIEKERENTLDKNIKMYKNYSKEEKAKVLFGFIDSNETNPIFQNEIIIAKRFLREMGIQYVK